MNLARRKPGQILILVLLIVVVALAVGLSVASRNITNLRSSAQTEQSQRAFTAAEGGVEDALSRLSSLAPTTVNTTSAPIPVTVGDLTANVTVGTSNVYQSTIPVGSVGQIDLTNILPATGGAQVQIDWGANGETPLASLGVTQYGSAGVCASTPPGAGCRTAWHDPTGPNASNEMGFSTPPPCTPSAGFSKCVLVNIQASSTILRVRPFWTTATVRVSGAPGTTLPVQKYDISSTANTTAGITRKVQVSRTALPQLPTVFDYVLFSNGDISK